MKTFKQLINEVFFFLKENTTAAPADNSSKNSFINLLYSMRPSDAGKLFGECLNVFTSTDIKEIEILVPERDAALYIFGAYTENGSLKHKMPEGKKAVYVTREDIDNLCTITDKNTMVKNMIEAENRQVKEIFSFSSIADPVPHKITDEMFGTRELTGKKRVKVPGTKSSYERYETKRVGTGIFVRNGNLTLTTTYTGRGVHSSNKTSSMDVGRGGRKTKAITNNYYINGLAKLFIKFNDKESYLVCIDKNKSTDSLKATTSSGSLNNVAIYNTNKATSGDLFYNTNFLNAAAEKLSLNSDEIYKILNTRQDTADILRPRQTNIVNRDSVKPFSSTIKELIQKAKTYANLYNNATAESIKMKWLEKWKEVCNALISAIKQDYPTLSLPQNEYSTIPKQVKEHLKKLQEKRKAVITANGRDKIDVRSAFKKR